MQPRQPITDALIYNDAPIYSVFGDDPDFAALVDDFVAVIPERIATLSMLANHRDWEQLRVVAHQIKGAAGSYGFDEVTPYAAALEIAAAERQSEQRIIQILKSLVSLCHRLRSGIPPAPSTCAGAK